MSDPLRLIGNNVYENRHLLKNRDVTIYWRDRGDSCVSPKREATGVLTQIVSEAKFYAFCFNLDHPYDCEQGEILRVVKAHNSGLELIVNQDIPGLHRMQREVW